MAEGATSTDKAFLWMITIVLGFVLLAGLLLGGLVRDCHHRREAFVIECLKAGKTADECQRALKSVESD